MTIKRNFIHSQLCVKVHYKQFMYNYSLQQKKKNKNNKVSLCPQLLHLTGEEVFLFNALIQGGLGHIVITNRYTTKV